MLLKGKPLADKNFKICEELIKLPGNQPHLYIYLLSADPASEYYVNSVIKQAQKLNILVTVDKEEKSESQLIQSITELNNNPNIHAIMAQKPLPKNINSNIIDQTIAPEKDIDGLHAINAGLMLQEKDCFLPCTAQAIIEMMDFYEISAEGKHVVVVGRSNIVGKPVANLLLYKQKNRNATVTVCHSRTPNLSDFTKQADILITAVGMPKLITNDMIKEGVIIIDAGINEVLDQNNKSIYVGDVDFESCVEKCESITPVPGGVGSVTTSILLKNLTMVSRC